MPRIQIGKAKRVLLLYGVRVVVATVCSYGVICAVGAAVIYKLDLDFKLIAYICTAVDYVCAFCIAKCALYGVKNSRLPLAFVAVLPAYILVIVHGAEVAYSVSLLVLRLIGIPVCAALAALSRKQVRL